MEKRKDRQDVAEIEFLSTFLTLSSRVPLDFPSLPRLVRLRISNFVSADAIFDIDIWIMTYAPVTEDRSQRT